jgi:hypothetical protein
MLGQDTVELSKPVELGRPVTNWNKPVQIGNPISLIHSQATENKPVNKDEPFDIRNYIPLGWASLGMDAYFYSRELTKLSNEARERGDYVLAKDLADQAVTVANKGIKQVKAGATNDIITLATGELLVVARGARIAKAAISGGNKLAGGALNKVTTATINAPKGVAWHRISGIVRGAAKGKGNFGLGAGTFDEAMTAGKSWVGDGFKIASDGKTMISADGLRQFRPPSFKPNLEKTQANFEWRNVNKGQWQGNGHLDIIGN